MISVEQFTQDKIDDVLKFERELRSQEPDTFFLDAGQGYRKLLEKSFCDEN